MQQLHPSKHTIARVTEHVSNLSVTVSNYISHSMCREISAKSICISPSLLISASLPLLIDTVLSIAMSTEAALAAKARLKELDAQVRRHTLIAAVAAAGQSHAFMVADMCTCHGVTCSRQMSV